MQPKIEKLPTKRYLITYYNSSEEANDENEPRELITRATTMGEAIGHLKDKIAKQLNCDESQICSDNLWIEGVHESAI